MEAINLKQIPTEYIMRTKGGNLWRCGRGYRKNWNKLIGKEVLLHGSSYTLTARVKKNGKWYLVYTDGTNSYTELQTKALHNKGMAKDTIIEAAKRVIAGLLTAPKDLLDVVVEEIDDVIRKINNIRAQGKQAMLNNPANYTKKGTLRKKVAQQIESWYKPFALYNEYIQGKDTLEYCNYTTNNGRSWFGVRQLVEANDFNCKCSYINHYIRTYVSYTSYTHVNKLCRQLKKIYHPDNKVTGDNKKFEYISNWAFSLATIPSSRLQAYKVEEQLLSRAGHISELYKNLCMEELCINAYTRPTIADMLNSIFSHGEQHEQYYQDLLDYYKLDEQLTELIKQEYAKFIEEYNFIQSRKRAI